MPGFKKTITLIEVIISLFVISIIVSTVLPLSEKAIRLEKEHLLLLRLRQIRYAIDSYFKKNGEKNYPISLEVLVKEKYLRRIPKDPMTKKNQWKQISSIDAPGEAYSGHDVFDIRSLSTKKSLNGENYNEW
ncbi:type II secretion system protein [Candidatus Riflebacteria bacterium]